MEVTISLCDHKHGTRTQHSTVRAIFVVADGPLYPHRTIRYNSASNCAGAGVRVGGWEIDGYAYGVDNSVRSNFTFVHLIKTSGVCSVLRHLWDAGACPPKTAPPAKAGGQRMAASSRNWGCVHRPYRGLFWPDHTFCGQSKRQADHECVTSWRCMLSLRDTNTGSSMPIGVGLQCSGGLGQAHGLVERKPQSKVGP